MDTLLGHLVAGRIRPLTHARMKLAEAGRAQAMLKSGEVMWELLLKP